MLIEIQKEEMTDTTESVDSAIARAAKHDAERVELDNYFTPFVEEWCDLHFRAGIFSRDDKMRGYWYHQTTDDSIIFHSESEYRDDRGDFEPLAETYIYIPFSFMTGVNDTTRPRLAEMIEERNAELEKAELERKARREAFKNA